MSDTTGPSKSDTSEIPLQSGACASAGAEPRSAPARRITARKVAVEPGRPLSTWLLIWDTQRGVVREGELYDGRARRTIQCGRTPGSGGGAVGDQIPAACAAGGIATFSLRSSALIAFANSSKGFAPDMYLPLTKNAGVPLNPIAVASAMSASTIGLP